MDYSQIDVEKVLEYFSIRNIAVRGDEIQFSCPFPEHYRGDRNPSSSINTKDGRWHCFGCGRSGTLISFVAEYDNVSPAVAIRWLRESYYSGDPTAKTSVKQALKKLLEKEKKQDEDKSIELYPYIERFRVDWERAEEAYREGSLPRALQRPFKDYRLSAQTLKGFQIGYDETTKRITIPIRNQYGTIIGFKGRATNNNKPKYLSLYKKHDMPRFLTGDTVFGIDSADGSAIIICEGEFDAISLREKGFKSSVALGTSTITDKQIKIIKQFSDSAYILFDPDQQGRKGAQKVAISLIPHLPVKIAEASGDSDPAEMEPSEITQAIAKAQIPQITHN